MLKQLSKLRGECIISNTTMSDMSQSREPKATPKQSPKQQPNEAACRTKTAQICTTQTIQKAPPKPSQQAPFTQNLKQWNNLRNSIASDIKTDLINIAEPLIGEIVPHTASVMHSMTIF
eukprot:168193_1